MSRSGFHLGMVWLVPCLLFLAWAPQGCGARKAYKYTDIAQRRGPALAQKSAPPPAPKLQGPISLRQAIGYALKYNPDQEMALARIRRSEAMADMSLAAFLPRVSAYAEFYRGDAPSAYLFKMIDQRALAPGVDFNHPGTFQNLEAGLRAGWNLFRGGRDVLQRRMAETGLAMSRLDRRSVSNALAASVTKSFYNCLAAEDFTAIARESVDSVSSQLAIMRVRRRAGGVLKSDVLSLEVRLAQARENLVRAENNRKLAAAALADLMGADLDAEIRPVDGPGPELKLPPDYRRGLDAALHMRPELLKARRRVVRAAMAVDQARGEYLPSLDARGNYYLDADNLDMKAENANWTGGLVLNWDLFTGLSTRAKEGEARAMLTEMLAADRKTARRVQLEVKTAYLNLQEARARLAVSRASVAQARESLKLVTRQYRGGSAGVTRYLDAELDLSRARVRACAAHRDTEKARSDIARALGLWAEYAGKETGRDVP